jgi:hypothetical protein
MLSIAVIKINTFLRRELVGFGFRPSVMVQGVSGVAIVRI